MRRSILYMTILLPPLVAAAYLGLNVRSEVRFDTPPRERRFEFTYYASVSKPPEGAGRVDLWLPYPKNDEGQEVCDIRVESDFPSQVGYDGENGNGILHVGADNPGDRAVEVSMKFKVVRREMKVGKGGRAAAGGAGNFPGGKFLSASRLVIVNDGMKKLAEKITAGKTGDIEKARAIYDYVANFMTYDKSGVGWGNGDTKFCLLEARGNCTDYHSLFLSLARSIGIPAKFEIGFPLPEERGGGEIAGYHCWAKFFTTEYGWIPIDNSEADKRPEKHEYFFGGLDENRILMSVGRDIKLVPRQKGGRINYFIYPYAEVDGAPVGDVKVSFSFRDLEPGGGESVVSLH